MTSDAAVPRSTRRHGGLELVRTVLDADSWVGWDTPAPPVAAHGSAYAAELAAAAQRSGADEALVTGEGRIRGRRVAVIAGEFAFLAGSIGSTAAEPSYRRPDTQRMALECV